MCVNFMIEKHYLKYSTHSFYRMKLKSIMSFIIFWLCASSFHLTLMSVLGEYVSFIIEDF